MKTLKNFLLILMLVSVTLLSSCMFPGPRHGNHGGMNPSHGQKVYHENNGHHDNGNHHKK
jgi:hypothetical protein